jgi:hypothetical protein
VDEGSVKHLRRAESFDDLVEYDGVGETAGQIRLA